MTSPNGLLILIDAFRYDLVADATFRRALMPNLDRLVASGSLEKITALASNTQFVMPAFLSGTAPFDYGGYNDGCKRRPACFAETIRAAGYETALVSNCVLYNRDLGFDRGFDHAIVPINTRRALMQDIEYRLLEPVRRWHRRETSDADIIDLLCREYGQVLKNIIRADDQDRATDAFPRARRINRHLARDAQRELAILERDPLSIAGKLATVPEAYYYAVLGEQKPGGRLQSVRIINKAYTLIGRFVGRLGFMKHLRFGHYDTLEPMFEELMPGIAKLTRRRDRPWFMMLHIMDVHTYSICVDQIFRAPRKFLRRLARLPRMRRLCREFGHESHILYVLGLSVVDDLVGEILREIEKDGMENDTVVVVTSDHGTTFECRDGRASPDLPRRFFRSDIETPLIVSGAGAEIEHSAGLRDSRDVGATLLDCLGLTIPDRFDGRSALSVESRDFVISENAGRNYCDLERDNLNFAITGRRSKLFAVLHGSKLEVTDYYDLETDPGEKQNLVDCPEARRGIETLVDHLWCERAEIFGARGCMRPEPSLPHVANG
jgi:hypothetical protein